jgi:hypothetical protein
MSEVGLMSFQTGENMDDTRFNNVNIGTISSSNVTLNQNQDGVQSISSMPIEYEVDDSTVEIIPMDKPKRNAAIFSITMAVASIGLLADVTGLFSYFNVSSLFPYFNISKGMAFLIFAPICLFVVFITQHDLWLTKL